MKYIFENEIELNRVRTLTSEERVKLKLYKKCVLGEINNPKLFADLAIYTLEHSLDLSLIKHLE